jgi:hypothetical protein
MDSLLKALTEAFGSLKIQWRVFEHCGIHHIQQSDFSVVTHQNHYAQTLHPITTTTIDITKTDALLDYTLHSLFMSLLGGLAWLNQTRLDTCIFIVALQRVASKPTVAHLLRLNAVCKWARRKEAFLTFKAIPTPCRLIVIQDSAFRREDVSGLAMRGDILALAGPPADAHNKNNSGEAAPEVVQLRILDWCARRQKRVVRSTFSAELNSMSDAVERSKLICLALTEIQFPQYGPIELKQAIDEGNLPYQIHVYTDCRSIHDALFPDDLKVPSESGLIVLLLIIKALLETKVIERLYWCDTHDMLADGLNKGGVARHMLLSAPSTGLWSLQYTAKWFTKRRIIP